MRAGAAAWLFVSSLVVYQANLRPVASADSLPAALLPFSIVLDGSVALDRFGPWLESVLPAARAFLRREGGHYYSGYPIAQPVLLAPFYAPVILASGARDWPVADVVLFGRMLEKLFASLLAAATVVLFYLLAARLASRGPALAASAVLAFATPMWATNSQALWQHTGGVLLIVAALLYVTRWDERPGAARNLALAGVCCGLALMVRPTNAILPAALSLALLRRRVGARTLAIFGAAPLLCAALVAAYNLRLFGDLRGGYALPLNRDVAGALAGLLFSPSRGLFVYCPFLLFAGFGLVRYRSAKRPFRLLFEAGAWFVGAHLLIYAVSPMWWGGHCWGPRLMAETVPFLVVMTIPVFERLQPSPWLRGALVGAIAWSVFLQAVGAFCYPRGYWDDLPGNHVRYADKFWDWRDNPVRRTLAGGIVWEPYVVLWEGLAHGKAAARQKIQQFGMRGF